MFPGEIGLQTGEIGLQTDKSTKLAIDTIWGIIRHCQIKEQV